MVIYRVIVLDQNYERVEEFIQGNQVSVSEGTLAILEYNKVIAAYAKGFWVQINIERILEDSNASTSTVDNSAR